MRRLIFTIGILFCVLNINAKTDTINISIDDKDEFLADNNVPDNDSTVDNNIDNNNVDTTRIMFGKKGITVIKRKDSKNNTTIHIEEIKEKYLNGDYDDDSASWEEGFGPHGKHPFRHHNKKFNPHWGGFELNLNNFMTSDYSMNLPAESRFLELNTGRSIGVKINLLEQPIPISRNMGFVTGLGFEFNSYYFDSDTNNITKENGRIVPKLKDRNAGEYSKNKLKDTYLTIPLLYEIQIPLGNRKKPLYVSAGVVGGLKLGSRTKEYYTLNGTDKKDVIKGDFYLSPIRYGYQARIGFRDIHLVATYYESPLFRNDKGPEVHPFDIGIMILNW